MYSRKDPKDTYFSVSGAGLPKLSLKQYSIYIHLLTTKITGMLMYYSSVSAGCVIKLLADMPLNHNKQKVQTLSAAKRKKRKKKSLNAALK